jgi:hypothetical protein
VRRACLLATAIALALSACLTPPVLAAQAPIPPVLAAQAPIPPVLAAQTVNLEVMLTPERLGRGTTIVFGFQIITPTGQAPSPLTAFDLSYPANLGLVTSGLGVAICSPAMLELAGPAGCPANSLMGYGTALVEIPFGPAIVQETGSILTFMAPLQDGSLGLLFYAHGRTPITAELIFPGLVLPAPAPYGGLLSAAVPPVPSLPGAPNAAVVALRSTLGPLGLTYYERVHGRPRTYRPRGIVLPEHCPPGGFPFAATFTFQDGTRARAHTAVPCPGGGGRHGSRASA